MARPRKALKDQHDTLIRSLAAKNGIPPGVLSRSMLVAKLDSLLTPIPVTNAAIESNLA